MAAEVVKLAVKRCFYLIKACHLGGGLFVQAHLFTSHQAHALVQRVFQRRAEVHIDGGSPLACLTVVRHNTAAVVPVASILGGIARVQQHLVAHAVAVDGGKACACADQVCYRVHKFSRAICLHADGKSRLVGLTFLGGFHRHKGDGVCAVLPVAGLAADRQVLELVVPSKIIRRVGRNRPHPLGIFEP